MKRFLRLSVILVVVLSTAFCFAASQTTSSTLASSIVDRAEVFLNDSDNRFWKEGELLQWLNDGMVDIAVRSQCMQETTTVALSTNTIEYSLSGVSYLAVKAVMYSNASSAVKGLIRGNPADVGRVPEDFLAASKRIPTYWYEWGGSLGIFPALASVTTESVILYYDKRPDAIGLTDYVTTPAEYDTALVYFIVAQAWMKEMKLSKYLQTISLYDAEMNRIRQDLNDMPPSALK